jgi:predicted DCC family thiol-disulfide oxidoreductase YuxK
MRPASGFSLVVLYDGECGLCRESVRRLRRADRRGRMEFLSSSDPSVPLLFPDIPPQALDQSIHVIDAEGEVWDRAEAVRVIASELPFLGLLAPILGLPGIRAAADSAYRWVAGNRFRLNCPDHCRSGRGN